MLPSCVDGHATPSHENGDLAPSNPRLPASARRHPRWHRARPRYRAPGIRTQARRKQKRVSLASNRRKECSSESSERPGMHQPSALRNKTNICRPIYCASPETRHLNSRRETGIPRHGGGHAVPPGDHSYRLHSHLPVPCCARLFSKENGTHTSTIELSIHMKFPASPANSSCSLAHQLQKPISNIRSLADQHIHRRSSLRSQRATWPKEAW